MENFRQFFTNLWTQINKFWGQLNTVKKMVVGGAIAAAVIGIGVLIAAKPDKTRNYLFVDISPEDSQAIIGYFKKNNINDYTVDSKGIQVPTEQLANLRLKLAQEGLPNQGFVGWEKFDKTDFTRTEFDQRIHKLRAIQGELQRTISSIEGVMSARVHIVTPQQSLFVEDKKEPTAAIYLRFKQNSRLNDKQIKGIVHMVSRSVEGLKPDNITIIDNEGRMLTEEKNDDPASQQTKEMLTYKRDVEKELETRIRGLVGKVAGHDRVDAKVDATIDYTKEEQTISDIDPDRVAIISSNTTNQDVNGQGLNPTGIPGSKSNVPGEQEDVSMATSSAKSTRGSERLNYEIAKTMSHKVLPVGTIKRISAAVIVDGKQVYPADGTTATFEPRTEEEMKKIEELVKTAIGFRDGRDEVRVHNMAFQLDAVQTTAIAEQKRETREYLSNLSISAVAALAMVLFFGFIVRPYFRWLAYDPERKRQEAHVTEFKPDLELTGVQSIQIKEDVPFDKMSPQEQVIYLAKHEPARTTEAIRMMLNPHASTH